MANEYLDTLKDETGSSHPLHDSRISDTNITTWTNKQDVLTFDSTPTKNSQNPVTSNGVYQAVSVLDTRVDTLEEYPVVLTYGETPSLSYSEISELAKKHLVLVKVVTPLTTDIYRPTFVGPNYLYFNKLDGNTGITVTYDNDDTWSMNTYAFALQGDIPTELTAGLDLKIEDSVVQVDAKLKTGTNRGTLAFAEGDNVEASGNSSHAEGGTTAATAACSHAEGCETKATNKQSHSEGYKTEASGECAHAEGNNAVANGKQSHAEGYAGVASGECAHAEGALGKALGTASHVEGGASTTYGKDSHAEGYATTTRAYKLKTGGSEMTESDWEAQPANTSQTDFSINVAQHSEGYNTLAAGIAAHSEGYATKAYGYASHSEGSSTTAFGEECHTEGVSTIAAGKYSHAEGAATVAYGTASHAEGMGGGRTSNNTVIPCTSAYGNACHAEGYGVYANGDGCHAEGMYKEYQAADSTYVIACTESHGDGSHAEGVGTCASSVGAHSEGSVDDGSYGDVLGQRVQATAPGAHAEGIGTIASSPGAHAEGVNAVASSLGAHAEGKYTLANSPYQHVVGKYNVSDASSNYAEIVGGGTSNTVRKNIRTLDWSGNETITGRSTANTVKANTSMTIGSTTFNEQSVIKWNKNSGQDTSDFELAGFMLVMHTTATANTAEYYPVNGDTETFGSMTNAQVFTTARTRCSKLSIQCAASMAINFNDFYSADMVGKTFEIVFANASTSGDVVIYLSNSHGSTTADNIRFINGVGDSGVPAGLFDGEISFSITRETCREFKFTILPKFDNNGTTYTLVCLWGLLNMMSAGSSTNPVYYNRGIPKAVTESISLTKSNEQVFVANHSNTGYSVTLGVGSGGYNRGVYDNTADSWIVYRDSSGNTHLGKNTVGLSSKPIYLNGRSSDCLHIIK